MTAEQLATAQREYVTTSRTAKRKRDRTILKALAAEMPVKEIARAVGVTPAAIRRIRKEGGTA